MPSRIPQAKRDSIKVKIALNETVKTISKNINVSSSAIYNYKKNLRQFNALKPPKVLPQGRPRKITPEIGKSEQMVFVDESAANKRTADRKWGWAPIGMPCIFEQALKRTKKWSLLPAYTVEGFLTLGIQRGSYHKEDFNDFIRYGVLPLMNPYPHEQNSILVMDNARIHKSDVLLPPSTLIEQELDNMCYEAGVLLEYLPPYSPDFTPIELACGRLKMWFKRNMQLCEAMDDMEAFIEMGMRQQWGSARGFFRKSQIGTALDEALDEA